MAEPIQNPLVGQVLQSAFGLQGRVRPSLETFVIPTVSLGDLSLGMTPDVARSASAFIDIAAVVGEQATLRFESIGGVICAIRQIHLFGDDDFTFIWAHRGNAAAIAALGTTEDKGFCDGRLLAGAPSGAQAPSGVLTDGTQVAALANPTGSIRVLATAGLVGFRPNNWFVGTGRPGLVGFLEMQCNTANSRIRGSIEWDEYPAV